MFIGHFGLGLGAKQAAPETSLGTLFAAAQFADLLWPTLVLLGYEQRGDTAWHDGRDAARTSSAIRTRTAWWRCASGAIAFGADLPRHPSRAVVAAITIALLVVSHWVLDYSRTGPTCR